MKYIVNDCTDAQWNMAHDEFLLEGVDDTVFSLWQNAPAVIIGLNQSAYAEVNLPYLQERGIMLARRVTGGGAVYHDLQNLNYSIAGPLKAMENALDLVPAALRQLGAPVERSGRNDLTVEGRKCSGYAKRLSKDRMMIHGTLMWDVDIDTLTEVLRVPGSKVDAAGVASVRSHVGNLKGWLPQFGDIKEFQAALHGLLAGDDAEIPVSPAQKADIDRQYREKFSTWDWVYGHSPAARFQKRKKFACGTVEIHYCLRNGCLAEVGFGGDFIGNRPADELAARLTGLRLEDLPGIGVADYFDNLSVADFLTLFDQASAL